MYSSCAGEGSRLRLRCVGESEQTKEASALASCRQKDDPQLL